MEPEKSDPMIRELRRLGITQFPVKELMEKSDAGSLTFSVNGEQRFDEIGKPETLAYRVDLRYVPSLGIYQPFQYQAWMKGQDQSESMMFRATPDMAIKLREAFNLMKGRTLQKPVANWKENSLRDFWCRFNSQTNERDANTRLEFLPAGTPYPLITLLKEKNIMEVHDPRKCLNLIVRMVHGEAVPVTVEHNGKTTPAFVEAAPFEGKVKMHITAEHLVQLQPKYKGRSI
jgi:hypothetical protein